MDAMDRSQGDEPAADWTVTSPDEGTFELHPATVVVTAEGELVPKGAVLAAVAGVEVRAPVGGWLMELLAAPHTTVTRGQPLVRLRPIAEHTAAG